jgi:hypothetical protein
MGKADQRFARIVLVVVLAFVATLLVAVRGFVPSASAITNTTTISLYDNNSLCIGVANDNSGSAVWLTHCDGPETRTWVERNIPAAWGSAGNFGEGPCANGGCVVFSDGNVDGGALNGRCILENGTRHAVLGKCDTNEAWFVINGTSNRLINNTFWLGDGYLQSGASDSLHTQLGGGGQCEGSAVCYDQWNNLQPGG